MEPGCAVTEIVRKTCCNERCNGMLSEHRLQVTGWKDMALLNRALAPDPQHLSARVVGVDETSRARQDVVAHVGKRLVLDSY